MRSVIVVFGGGSTAGFQPSAATKSRLDAALREAHRQPGAPVIVSGAAVSGATEALVMRRWLIDHGFDDKRIIVEPCAQYTLDNANKVAPLIVGTRATRVTLVTQKFHMRRSTMLLEGALKKVSRRPFTIRQVAAPDTVTGTRAVALHVAEAVKLARDLITLSAQAYAPHPPKIVRAHACAGSIKIHKTSQ